MRAIVVVAALVGSGLVLAAPGSAGATALTAAGETAFRDALATLSADTSGDHTLTLTADVTIADAGDPVYDGEQALTIDGAGHSITVTAAGTRALRTTDEAAAITLVDVEISGGAPASGDGGGVEVAGDLTVRTGYVHDNTASGGGGGLHAGGVLTVDRSTLAANTAATGGGAAAPTVDVLTSTITDNTATTSGGGLATGALQADWSTVVDNSAPAGANLTVTSVVGEASVIAAPQGGGTNCASAVANTTSGFRVSDSSCLQTTSGGNVILGAEPAFGDLADNGGPTPTRLPPPHAGLTRVYVCATTQGSNAPDPDLPADQRGVPRPHITFPSSTPFTLNHFCDVGAVTVEEVAITVTVDPPAVTVVEGGSSSVEVTVTNDGPHDIERLLIHAGGGGLCTEPPGYPSLVVGQSYTATCPVENTGGHAGDTTGVTMLVMPASAWTPDSSFGEHFPLTVRTIAAAEIRIICGTNVRPDVGAWLDPAMSWFDCDARHLSDGDAAPFRPRQFLTRIGLARLLVQATETDAVPVPPYPTVDVPSAQRAIVRQVVTDPDGAGPRLAAMSGYPGGRFRPGEPVGRAQVVRALWRWVGAPTGFTHSFSDVPPWADVSVGWAATEHDAAAPLTPVVTGFGGGTTFLPYGSATKGTVLQMLYRADHWLDTAGG